MKKVLCRLCPVVSLLLLPTAALADFSEDATTIVRVEQHDLGTQKETIMPATQFLGLDADKLADGKLSAHFYGWGRYDLADKSYNNDTAAGSLTYGYLRYRFDQANADLRLGRFFVREGIVNEQVDGVGAHTDLPLGFTLSAFGGATVHGRHLLNENSDGRGDGIIGGRAGYRYRGMLEAGLSGVYESQAPHLVNYQSGNHRLVGGDIWLSPTSMVEFMGHTSYNPETRGVAEHSYLLNIKPLRDLVVTAEFNEQHDRNYLYAWTMFSGAALNPADKSRSTGGSASYGIAKGVEVAADYKHYSRELGNADRYGGDLRLNNLDNTVRAGFSYHYLRAGQGFAITGTPSASYQELHGYLLRDAGAYFTSIDAIGYLFTEKIHNQGSAWETTASLGYRFNKALALSGDIGYGRNPQFTEEIKGLIRLTYAMAQESKGEKK